MDVLRGRDRRFRTSSLIPDCQSQFLSNLFFSSWDSRKVGALLDLYLYHEEKSLGPQSSSHVYTEIHAIISNPISWCWTAAWDALVLGLLSFCFSFIYFCFLLFSEACLADLVYFGLVLFFRRSVFVTFLMGFSSVSWPRRSCCLASSCAAWFVGVGQNFFSFFFWASNLTFPFLVKKKKNWQQNLFLPSKTSK